MSLFWIKGNETETFRNLGNAQVTMIYFDLEILIMKAVCPAVSRAEISKKNLEEKHAKEC